MESDAGPGRGRIKRWKLPRRTSWIIWLLGAVVLIGGLVWFLLSSSAFQMHLSLNDVAVIAAVIGSVVVIFTWLFERPSVSVGAARERLRQAEQDLAESLKQGSRAVLEAPTAPEQRAAQVAQERLTLPALWEVTHSRLNLYHQIATVQARRSFVAAQVAMGLGFALLIVFAVLAARTQTVAGAVTTAGLGAVSAALAGYISRTFVRSQESAATHLRAYFDQPLEFSKYLAAERLLASNAEMESDKQAAILTTLVQAIVAPSPSANGTTSKRRRRKATQ